MNIVSIPLSKLKRPERNVRIHPEKQIREMIRSLEKFQQTRALVVDEDYTVLVGNGILTAMERMGYQAADCHIVAGLSEAEKKKLMLADNRVFDLGVDDLSALDAFVLELKDDLDIPGYEEDLLRAMVMEADEAADTLSEYGTIDEERIEEIRDARERTEAREEAAARNAEEYVPPAAGTQPQEEGPARRFILCPKCGERIWL